MNSNPQTTSPQTSTPQTSSPLTSDHQISTTQTPSTTPPHIVTLTLNPAIDVSTSVDVVVHDDKLRCGPSHYDAGGGGINVARVLKRLGEDPLAIYTAGGPTGEMLTLLLERENVDTSPLPIRQFTRESFTIDETSTGKEFRFVLQGPELGEDELGLALKTVSSAISGADFLVASGALPPGAPVDMYAQVARIAKAQGVKCVVDASGDALQAALDEGVFMVKPSLRELEQLVGRELPSRDAIVDAARELVRGEGGERSGGAVIVAVSLGKDGALVATARESLFLASPDVQVKGTVGAGDSFVAGFVWRLAQGGSVAEALRSAVAAGTATVSCPLTAMCDGDLVHTFEKQLDHPTSI